MSDQDVGKQQLETGFWVGDWYVDPSSNLLSRAGEDCRVEPKVMHVLVCLAEQPMRTVTKEAFMQEVWNGTVVTDDALSRCISELRKVLGGSPRNPQFIETIRKSGYRLIAPVTYAADPNLNGEGQSGASSVGVRPTPSNGWAPRARRQASWMAPASLLWIAGLSFVALFAFLWFSGAFENNTENPFRTIPFTSLPGEELQPAPSPDGEQIAFVWNGEEGDNYDIYVKQVGTETLLPLTDDPSNESSPAWSPDGKSVAFARCIDANQCGMFTVPALGGAEREIASIGPRSIEALVWSPDEQTLAYSARSEPGEALSIYLLSVETLQERKLTTPPASSFGDLDPAFSPDGERIAFTRSVVEGVQNIYVVSVQGGTPRELTSDNAEITGLDWSSNGEIVFASNRGGASSLWRIPLAGGTPSWIATAGDGVSVHHPSVSRTGEHLSYEQRATETNIWELQRGRSQGRPLISSTRWDSNPAFSPDGERIAFASQRTGSQEIWVSERDGSDPVRLTFFEGPFASSPRWSPDGAQIAFDSKGGEDEGTADVYVMSTAGDQPRPLTTSEADDFAPSWSRDGQWVYFVSNRSGTWQIWRMPAVGGTAEQVTRKGGVMAFESFDGEWLYYAKGDTAGIWRTPTSGFPNTAVPDYAALLADSMARAGASVGSLNAASGPGSLAASAKPGSLAVVDTTGFAVAEAAAEAAFEEELVLAQLAPSDVGNWAVLEEGIYFIRRRETGPVIELLSFEDGKLYPIASLNSLPEHPSFAVSPDGNWFLYTQVDRSESDILMVEKFH